MIDTLNGALMLNQKLLQSMRESPDVVRRGVMIVVLVGVLVGMVDGVRQAMATLQPEQALAQQQDFMEEFVDQMALNSTTPEMRVMLGFFNDNMESGFTLLKEVNALPVPLPTPLVALVRGLGVLVSWPLVYLERVLIIVAFTHIVARWFGGKGTIQQMVGLGALSVAPHALDALSIIPILGQLGSMLSMIAWSWGVVILIFATSVAHDMKPGRATLAIFFFPILGIMLFGLGCCLLSLLSIAGAGLA